MAVRRRRPLVPPPYPRRNPYTPVLIRAASAPLVPAVLRLPEPRSASLPLFQRRRARHQSWADWVESSYTIIAHSRVEMCYDFVTVCRGGPFHAGGARGCRFPGPGASLRLNTGGLRILRRSLKRRYLALCFLPEEDRASPDPAAVRSKAIRSLPLRKQAIQPAPQSCTSPCIVPRWRRWTCMVTAPSSPRRMPVAPF